MRRNCLCVIGVMFCVAAIVPDAGAANPAPAEETEILKVTVGEPTKLSDLVYQNTASLMVSRTGVVAVFYPKPGTGPKFYRVSTDSGQTWSPEMNGPPELEGGADSGTLRDGGVIIAAKDPQSSTNYTRAKGWTGDPDPFIEIPNIELLLPLRFQPLRQQFQMESFLVHLFLPDIFQFVIHSKQAAINLVCEFFVHKVV